MSKSRYAVVWLVALVSAPTLVALWIVAKARAAVAVRPELSDVGLIQATLTGHGIDWIGYNYSTKLVIGAGLLGLLLWIALYVTN